MFLVCFLVLFWRAMVILHKYNKRCKDQRFLRAMAVQYAEIFHILKTGQKKEKKKKKKGGTLTQNNSITEKFWTNEKHRTI